jgi:hypothetical protein
LIPDLFTDYLASIAEEEKDVWLEKMKEWKPEFGQSSMTEYEIEVRALTDDDVAVLVARMNEHDISKLLEGKNISP